MAWTCLVESAASPSPSKSGSRRSHTAKSTPTLAQSSFLVCLTDKYPPRPYGTTSPRSTAPCYPSSPKSSTEASPAKTFPLPAAERAWAESVPAFSMRSLGLLAKYDHLSFSWKTFQRSLFEASETLSESFPGFGMTVGGEFYPLRTWGRRTDEIDGGSLPTPCTVDGGSYFNKSKSSGATNRPTLGAMAKFSLWPTPRANKVGGYSSPGFRPTLEQVVKSQTDRQTDRRSQRLGRRTRTGRA